MTPPLVTTRAVILHPELNAVLTLGGDLPQVSHMGSLYLGSTVSELFRPLAGGPLTLLRRLAYRRISAAGSEPVRVDAVFALTAQGAELPDGGAWTRPEKLTGDYRNYARVALNPDPRIPWWHRGWFQEALAWADEVLLSHGVERMSEPVLAKTWQASALYRLSAGDAVYYLKAVPSCFAQEGGLTRWLHALQPGAAAPVLDIRDASLFLMAGVQGRDFVEADAEAVLSVLGTAQRRAETRTHELSGLGCRERSPARLARQVEALLADTPAFLSGEEDGFTEEETERLLDAMPLVLAMCRRLSASPIPPTLVHGDMHGGNVAIGREGVTLLDWSDAAIGFPFLDANVFYFLGPTTSPEQQAAVRDSYLRVWTDLLPLNDLRRLYRDAVVLGEFHRAVSYHRYIMPTLPDKEEWRDAHLWHLRRALELLKGKDWTWLGFH